MLLTEMWGATDFGNWMGNLGMILQPAFSVYKSVHNVTIFGNPQLQHSSDRPLIILPGFYRDWPPD